jgi:arylsulfatase A-like enzyme
VVENKDRYLEARHYFDEWDKALRARGLVKQQRELYRKRPDYRERLGAFEWELPEDLHSDFFVGDMACWWLRSYPKTEPLFLQIGFPGPHPPYDPIPRYAEPYLKKNLPLPSVSEKDLQSQPPPYLAMRIHNTEVDHDSIVHLLNPTPEQLHRQWAYYFANVTMIDEKIGQVLKTLQKVGYLENAVVIFTSDHGDAMEDHGHSQKWTMYDVITRMPMIVWAPGRFTGGRQIEGLCQHMDMGPTILELAGAKAKWSMEAESLLPALRGESWEGRDYVFAEHGRDAILQKTEFETMLRSRDWKLVHFLDERFGQLFNLKEDPEENNNLWEDPRWAAKKQELFQVLLNWRIRSSWRLRLHQQQINKRLQG